MNRVNERPGNGQSDAPGDAAPPPITADQARAAIEADRKARVEACGAEMDAVLRRHRCVLRALPAFTPDGRVAAQIGVVCED